MSRFDQGGLQEVCSVTEFALRHKLTSGQQLRLLKLLGAFATKQELNVNARLESKIRY